MRPIKSIAASLVILLGSASLAQEQGRAVSVLSELLRPIQTLQAEVTQLIVESDGGVLEESQIAMKLKKPDGFYWETVEPFPELIVTDGKTLWNYQPDLEQVVVEDWNSDDSELAAKLLGGNTGGLEEEYSITLDVDASSSQFELTPLDPNSPYRVIRIEFITDQLESIYLENLSGERTVWQFAELRLNESLADQLFQFQPPAGIEVIENRYVQ